MASSWRGAGSGETFRVEMGENVHVDVRLSEASGDTAAKLNALAIPTAADWRATYPSAGYRILGAARVWSTIRLFYPYKSLIGENWDDQLRAALPAVEQARDATRVRESHRCVRGAYPRHARQHRKRGAPHIHWCRADWSGRAADRESARHHPHRRFERRACRPASWRCRAVRRWTNRSTSGSRGSRRTSPRARRSRCAIAFNPPCSTAGHDAGATRRARRYGR